MELKKERNLAARKKKCLNECDIAANSAKKLSHISSFENFDYFNQLTKIIYAI